MIRPLARARRARKNVSTALAFLFVLALLAPPRAAERTAKAQVTEGGVGQQSQQAVPNIPPGSAYRLTTLVSDIPGQAPVLDPLLVNPWGIAVRGTSPFWVVNNGTSTTQLIRESGSVPATLNPSPQTVAIPGGLPTGVVGNTTSDFQITPPGGGSPAPASFIFDSIVGNITAWNGASGGAAQIVASMPGHVWTGLAIGAATGGNRIYAADFANNHIDVFDGNFTATAVPGNFVDPTVPPGYHPYNIQNLGGSLYVTYARIDDMGRVRNGAGEGYVRKFNPDGVRDPAFAINAGALDAPWGLALAPASFGAFSSKLLVGNFAPAGRINAYDPNTGAAFVPTGLPDNTLRNEAGQPIEISGLWGLQPGNGGNGGDANAIYFTAGPPGSPSEEHGIFGRLNATTATATSLIQFATSNFAVDEAAGHVDFSVVRTGDSSATATVNYNTADFSTAGHASQKSDYEIALGSLTFNPGETLKTFRILLVNDNFVEGDEVIDLSLTNPSGAGVGLGSPNAARVTILDNDAAPSGTNPIDNSSFFARQHYLDFLNREPDASGLAHWTNEIESCGGDAQCREVKRINVSAAFFLSIEFQRTGVLAYTTHRAAFGPNAAGGSPAPVLYGNFMRDVQALQRNLVFGQPDFDATLEANKTAYFNEFVTRPEFVVKYPSTLSNQDYVDRLLQAANLTPGEVRLFVVSMTNSQEPGNVVPTTTAGAPRPASFGTARFQFNQAQTAMTFSATVNNIDVTGSQTADTNDNLTAAHIHAGPAVTGSVNGPVVWGFFGLPFNDNNPPDSTATPFASGVGGTFAGKWDAPEGNNTTLAAQLDHLRSGRAYINFHTRQFPGGEIRGDLRPADTFRNSLINGLNAGTETRATVLRKVAEAEEMQTREFNAAFVTMEYFGYLRRDPDPAGFDFWLGKLNSFNGDFIKAEMVKAFITSAEYRQRFGAS